MYLSSYTHIEPLSFYSMLLLTEHLVHRPYHSTAVFNCDLVLALTTTSCHALKSHFHFRIHSSSSLRLGLDGISKKPCFWALEYLHNSSWRTTMMSYSCLLFIVLKGQKVNRSFFMHRVSSSVPCLEQIKKHALYFTWRWRILGDAFLSSGRKNEILGWSKSLFRFFHNI